MRVNALLVLYAGGYQAYFDTASEAEMGRTVWEYLEVGDVQSEDEAQRIAEAEFARYASEQVAFTATVDPRNGPVPYADYAHGDTVLLPNIEAGTTTERVSGFTWSEDDDGKVSYSVDVGEQAEDVEVRVLRWLERTNPGTLDGRAERASPFRWARPKGTKSVRKDRVVASFYDADPEAGERGGPWRFDRETRVVEVRATAIGDVGAGISTYDLYHYDDGEDSSPVLFDSISIAAGERTALLFVDETFAVDSVAAVETDVDGGHTQVTIEFLRDP